MAMNDSGDVTSVPAAQPNGAVRAARAAIESAAGKQTDLDDCLGVLSTIFKARSVGASGIWRRGYRWFDRHG